MKGQSVYTLIGGIEDLTGAIVTALENNPNIEIRKEASVEKLTVEEEKPDLKVCQAVVLNDLVKAIFSPSIKSSHG